MKRLHNFLYFTTKIGGVVNRVTSGNVTFFDVFYPFFSRMQRQFKWRLKMEEKIYVRMQDGTEHVVCAGSKTTGEIIFAPTKRDMLRLCLMQNQPATFRKKINQQDWLIIIRWDGKDFSATCKAA